MTVETLKDCNKKVLARMAKDQGIVGWHSMRKDQLIRALTPSTPTAIGKKPKSKTMPPKKASPRAKSNARTASSRSAVAPPPSAPWRPYRLGL